MVQPRQCVVDLGRYEEAIASYDKAVEFKPDDHQAWNNRGVALFNLGRYEEAIASFDKVVEFKPDLHEAWNNRGNALDDLGRYEEAIASYDKAVEFNPDKHEAWYNRGVALFNLGRYEEAIAFFDKAVEFKPDFHEAWNNRGVALFNLGRYEEAIASYDKAVEFKPDKHEAWFNRGVALDDLGRYEEAIASWDKAVEFKPDDHQAWNNRGVALDDLGRYEEAIASFDKAVEFKPDLHEAWNNRGNALFNLGRYEEAIASYDKAVEFKPDKHEAWFNRGVALDDLGRYEEAIASWDKAVEFKPDFHEAWNNRGVALGNLGRYEEAIASYDKAVEFKPDFHEAWVNRGVALDDLGRYEEAIASFDKAVEFKPDDHQAWNNRGNTVGKLTHPIQMPSLLILQNPKLNQPGYLGQIATYAEGLKHCPADTHPEDWGVLQHAMGRAHYFRGKQPNERNPRQYFRQARDCYAAALQTLTEEQFKKRHLKVVRDLVNVLLSLGEREAAKDRQFHSLRVLLDLINQTPSPTVQNRLEDEFASFRQWGVDRLVRENKLQLALETAERDKNRRLSWILSGRTTRRSPDWADIPRLFSPNTAAILYWHKSSDKLTTFILEPGAASPKAVVADAAAVDAWIGEWDRLYRDYGTKGKSLAGKEEHPWRREMPERLAQLGRILGVAEILEEMEEGNSRMEDGDFNRPIRRHLILIPHRELHRLPLHALFPGYCCTYLPSLQMGIDLSKSVGNSSSSGILSIEHPNHEGLDLLYAAEMESHVLWQMFAGEGEDAGEWNSRRQEQNPPSRIEENQSIATDAATDDAVIAALQQPHRYLHFNGHASHEKNPAQSALYLSGGDMLTVADIRELNLRGYELAVLSACETGVTNLETVDAEYVGLASAFLKAGVRQVVSTLWTVQSDASALLMLYFYRKVRRGCSASLALVKAIGWLRGLTDVKLERLYRRMLGRLSSEDKLAVWVRTELCRLEEMGVEQKRCRRFDAPYFWAAFMLTNLGDVDGGDLIGAGD